MWSSYRPARNVHCRKGINVKLKRLGLGAGVLLAAVAMAACSSSGSAGGNKTSSPTDTGSATSSVSTTGSIDCTGAAPLKVSGSTAQANAIGALEKAYAAKCGNAWTYAGGGSGQGVTDFTGSKVDFAGSDAALNPDKGEVTAANAACGSPALDIPMVTGPIAVVFKVDGVSNLTFTPSTLAKIFTGKITKWNDSEIAKENPNAKLPSANITVFFRADQSGTTENFEKYLNTAAPSDYTATPSKTWVGTGQGKTGSSGIQQAITSTNDSISYVEWSYTGGGIDKAEIDNGGGAVALTAETAGAAVSSATLAPNSNPGDLTLKLDYATKTPGAYPIILVTYEIVCSKYKDAATAAAVKSFLTYAASSAGQASLPAIGSAPLPSSILTKVQAAVASIS